MNKSYKIAAKAAKDITREAQGLLDATEDAVGEQITEARAKLKDSIELAQEKFGDAWDQTLKTVKTANKYLKKQPYLALGIGIGVGLLLALAARAQSSRD